jgi:hypothetical protein
LQSKKCVKAVVKTARGTTLAKQEMCKAVVKTARGTTLARQEMCKSVRQERSRHKK